MNPHNGLIHYQIHFYYPKNRPSAWILESLKLIFNYGCKCISWVALEGTRKTNPPKNHSVIYAPCEVENMP